MRFLSNVAASALGALLALGLLLVLAFFFVLAIALSADSGEPRVADGSVLQIEFSGPIPESVSSDPFAEAFLNERRYDLRDVTGALRKAAADERIQGVWLEMEGVTAAWATLEEVRRALEQFRAESGKPIYASAADFGMSEKDYFLATTADSVFAAPEAPFELNGFYTSVAFFEGTFNKFGIEPEVIRAGTYKSAVEPFIRQDLSAANREQLAEILATQRGQFLRAVASGRERDTSAVGQLAQDGAIISAEGALSAGLLDGLLHRDGVQGIWRERLGLEADEEPETVSLADYARVPASDAGLDTGGDGRIAVVYANGQIVSGETDDGFSFGNAPDEIGSETFAKAMRAARENDGVDAVVLRVNSPGGSVSASEAMLHQVELTAAEKPLIVSMGDYAASGGYWISTAADTIVADPMTLTGSIGVFSVLFNTQELFNEELGITFDAVRTDPTADLFSGVRPLSDRERQILQRSVERTYQSFLQKVAQSRGLTTAEVDSIAQGRVWTGQDALRVGLVDTLGTLDDAIGMVAQSAGLAPGSYGVTTYPRPKSFFERFSAGAGASARAAWADATTSAVERAFLQQRRTLRRLARQHGRTQARLPYDLAIE